MKTRKTAGQVAVGDILLFGEIMVRWKVSRVLRITPKTVRLFVTGTGITSSFDFRNWTVVEVEVEGSR